MNGDIQIRELEQKVEALISGEPDLFLVELRIKPTNNIKVFIDGDQGVSIDKLVHFNRVFYKQLEESGFFPNDDFSLEVSSPGLDEPLKLLRQYRKNIGRNVEVIEKEGIKIEGFKLKRKLQPENDSLHDVNDLQHFFMKRRNKDSTLFKRIFTNREY